MRVLIVDSDECLLALAWRAAEAGHEVKLWMPSMNGVGSQTGKGFPRIERVQNWRSHMQWAREGLIVNGFNDRSITKELDKWKMLGFPVFGPSAKSADLEWNRGKGMKFFEAHGIEVPAYRSFDSFDKLLEAAWKAQDPYVFKQTGDAEDKSSSFVASDPAELVGWLEAKKAQGKAMKGPFILQEKIDMLCEMGVSGWMGRDGFIPGRWTINFEFKRALPGDRGPNTGETGSVIRYCEDSGLAEDVLLPMEESLVKLGHIGDTDVNCGIDRKGKAWPFEWCNRFGYPSTLIVLGSHLGDPVQWMKDSLAGKHSLEVDDRVSMGVVLARPPFPNLPEDPNASLGFPIEGMDEIWDHIEPWQMMIEKGAQWKDGQVKEGRVYKTTGEYIAVAHAHGSDLHDAIAGVYAVAEKIKTPDLIYRDDVGKSLEKKLPALKALGYSEVPDW